MSPISNLSPTARKSLAAAAYVGAVAAFIAGSVWLVEDIEAKRDGVQQASLQLDQLSRRTPRVPRTGRADPSLFLSGPTLTIAAAALEQRIKDIARKSGGALTSSQVEPDSPDAKDGLVRLTASIEVDQSGLQPILYDIEAGTPFLFVDKLSVQSPEDFGEAEEGGRFRMTLAVVGQWRPVQ